jgi:hypothetical protein
MNKLEVRGLKREKNRVFLTLIDYNPEQVSRMFKGFRYDVLQEDGPVLVITSSRKNSKKLTKILNEKLKFVKRLESRFKQYNLIASTEELEIYPLGLQELDTIAAPIQSVLNKFGDSFDFYVGHKMKYLNTIKSKDFKKTFLNLVKQSKTVDNFFLKGKYLNVGFKNNKFIITGEKLKPATKHFMKNG